MHCLSIALLTICLTIVSVEMIEDPFLQSLRMASQQEKRYAQSSHSNINNKDNSHKNQPTSFNIKSVSEKPKHLVEQPTITKQNPEPAAKPKPIPIATQMASAKKRNEEKNPKSTPQNPKHTKAEETPKTIKKTNEGTDVQNTAKESKIIKQGKDAKVDQSLRESLSGHGTQRLNSKKSKTDKKVKH